MHGGTSEAMYSFGATLSGPRGKQKAERISLANGSSVAGVMNLMHRSVLLLPP